MTRSKDERQKNGAFLPVAFAESERKVKRIGYKSLKVLNMLNAKAVYNSKSLLACQKWQGIRNVAKIAWSRTFIQKGGFYLYG